MSGLSTYPSLTSRALNRLFGPELRVKRRGHFLVIVDRLGRVVSYSRGVIGGQWSWREIYRPPAEQPQPELWQRRIAWINAKCNEWQVKLNQMRSATSAGK